MSDQTNTSTTEPIATDTVAPRLIQFQVGKPEDPTDPNEVVECIVYDPTSPDNPTPGKVHLDLALSEDRIEAAKEMQAKIAEIAKEPKCLEKDFWVDILSTLPSMRGLANGFGICIHNPDTERFMSWVRLQLSDKETCDAYNSEYWTTIADPLDKYFGFKTWDTKMLLKIAEHYTREFSNRDAEIIANFTPFQAMRLLVRNEYKRIMAAQDPQSRRDSASRAQ